MALPDDINDSRWLKYDYQTVANPNPNFQIMKPMELIDFIEMVTNLNPDDVNVTTWTYTNSKSETFTLYCRNDVPPQYYTATDDRAVLFDAYDNTVDTTLQQSKTMLFGQKKYDWQDTDTFVTPLDHKQSQRLLHMAKSLAFAELKQTPHASADRAARIIQIDQQASKHKVLHNNYQNTTYSFGRRPMGRTKPTGRYK
jgi:hypothetical protein